MGDRSGRWHGRLGSTSAGACAAQIGACWYGVCVRVNRATWCVWRWGLAGAGRSGAARRVAARGRAANDCTTF
eukprot:4040004-Prymnesium_polylepis.1